MNRRSSSLLIQRRSLVMTFIAPTLVTKELNAVYNSNLLVTCGGKNKIYRIMSCFYSWCRPVVIDALGEDSVCMMAGEELPAGCAWKCRERERV